MIIRLEKDVFKCSPQLKIGFILAEGINNNAKLKEAGRLVKEEEEAVRLIFNKETIKNHYLIAPWAVAQREFGKKAKHYHTSIERLLLKVLGGKSVLAEDTATNLLTHIAFKHIIPFGADDVDKIKGNITFSIVKGKEKKKLLKNLKEGELFYHDAEKILGTKLDYWKNKKTKLSKSSASVLVHFEALPPITRKKLDSVLEETAALIKAFCGGKTKVFVLEKRKSVFVLEKKKSSVKV
ncbi:MAG: phenylalanine--tRNA ligase beta subunit-related protein [Nanoarchaeota archaeon]